MSTHRQKFRTPWGGGPLLFVLFWALSFVGCREGRTLETPPSPEVSRSSSTPVSPSFQAVPEITNNLKRHVAFLSEKIGERNLDHLENYAKASAYLSAELNSYGYEIERQGYQVDGQTVENFWAVRPGTSDEVLVVGAHYDTAHGTPGADDNASGCAALLELARLAKDEPDGPTLRFVFFANEEPPYFYTPAMGSLVYAKSCQERQEKLLGMIALESMGFYSDAANSQHFPPGISGYPDTGSFVGFVSDLSSNTFMQRCLAGFRSGQTFPAEGLSAPGQIEGVGWSDHWAFWQAGYSALMVTDTAPFRNPNYHRPTDTLETLDFESLSKVVSGLHWMQKTLTKGT